MMKKTLGGDRLGAGKKMQVELHNYERSTHDLSYIWRSTMSVGTLVPFMSYVGLPGDTFDINLATQVHTLPTVGPLFGSMKAQFDVFMVPIRLYNSLLHNNMLGIGLDMSKVKLPQVRLTAREIDLTKISDLDNAQINPSSLLSYFGLRGIGMTDTTAQRDFNAIPILAYWEIYKNYYSNKQEKKGAVIHCNAPDLNYTVSSVEATDSGTSWTIEQRPVLSLARDLTPSTFIVVNYTTTAPNPKEVFIYLSGYGAISYFDLVGGIYSDNGAAFQGSYDFNRFGLTYAENWDYINDLEPRQVEPVVATFDLDNIDDMRKEILKFSSETTPFLLNDYPAYTPYVWLYGQPNGIPNVLSSQEGLGIKTYQSDLLNNWLETEYMNYISDISSVSTAGDSFTIDSLNLANKVYDMLNRIAVSGGTYDDWLDVQYMESRYRRAESPIYMGGLIKEIVFDEVVSSQKTDEQPLGTLAGRGRYNGKHKGGNIVVKVEEPCYIIGIASITPRIDYSQGNNWDLHLKTMNDLHVPALDEIGFQDLITEQAAWFDTEWNGTTWVQKSAGKQPAWINYMTDINKTRGNFAIKDNQMFMTLNRRYEYEIGQGIKDMTTYIDPVKYNYIFAQTSLDAQNFWMQIGVNTTARRKMSAKIMPNL